MADFEKASTQAFVHHFPDAEIKGCWFHFRQAINRNAIRYGLKQHYCKLEYKKFINCLGALALLPLDKIQEAFALIKSFMPNDTKCNQLYRYFERQWIKSNFFLNLNIKILLFF